MHTTVLYHGNCPDGFGAALVCWQEWHDNAQYLPVSYGQPLPHDQIPGTHDVYIVDFSYPAHELVALQQGRPLSQDRPRADRQIVVLDHHASAQRDLQPLVDAPRPGIHVLFDMEESGATLTWKYLKTGGWHPRKDPEVEGLEHSLPRFFTYLRDRDLWQWKLPHSRAISLALWSLPRDFLAWQYFAESLQDPARYQQIVGEGQAIMRYADQLVAEQAKRAVYRTIGGYLVPVVNATTLFSGVGDYLCTHGTPLVSEPPLFCAYYFDRNDKQREWGLHGHGEVDLSQVAKSYGGGGHHDAAGFVTGQNFYGDMLVSEG